MLDMPSKCQNWEQSIHLFITEWKIWIQRFLFIRICSIKFLDFREHFFLSKSKSNKKGLGYSGKGKSKKSKIKNKNAWRGFRVQSMYLTNQIAISTKTISTANKSIQNLINKIQKVIKI